MSSLKISCDIKNIEGTIRLDGSKSLSNRALIIRALANANFKINNICESDDSIILQRLLSQSIEDVYDAGHAGTSYRFMTAYLAIQEGSHTLTGSSRMKERPIKLLVEALNSIGADIKYLENEGYPPLQINSFDKNKYSKNVTIAGNLSSQYISALVMVAPTLPEGLTITIDGDLVSTPYLQMTLNMMSYFGIKYSWEDNVIHIEHQAYSNKDVIIEADWSAASYFYSIASIADTADIRLQGLFKDSWQGDAAIETIATDFGIETSYDDDGIRIVKNSSKNKALIDYDFVEQPDIAQTVAIMCAASNIEGFFTGLQTLRIKETDRIEALKIELAKVGVSLYKLPPKFSAKTQKEYYGVSGIASTESIPAFDTYRDHRMAMAFAPLALRFPIQINNPEVVSKSYVKFWDDLESLGFKIER